MEWLKKIVDRTLEEMKQEEIRMMMPGDIPAEMLDSTIPPSDDWKGWKPINSIITDDDIDQFENDIGHKLPLSYRAYLQYKHFYWLRLPDIAVNLRANLPDKSLSDLRYLVFDTHEPELILGKNYIYFADFHDYGLLCFDANEPATDNEYKIVYMDHENLEDIHFYTNNFRSLLEGHSDYGNDFIDKLNEYYK
jgi:hypothetical protein